MPQQPLVSRRRALQTLFCSSAALALNVRPRRVSAAAFAEDDAHLLAIGDFGSGGKEQTSVANAMQKYVAGHGKSPGGLLLLGDNFYGKMEGGLESARWKSGFEDIYPAKVFPGPCWTILGNHDYHDNAGGELTQLAYAKRGGTRWTMPHKWFRFEYPATNPVATFLCVDSNDRVVSGGTDNKTKKKRNSLTAEEETAQLAWLKSELAKPRAAFTVVVGHHPLYSNGSHGDSKSLIQAWGDLFDANGVHLYLCGHDHDLQHLEIAGRKTSFAVSGGGGARIRALKSERPTPYGKDVYGFSHLQVNSQRLLLRHIDANGKQVHAFSKRPDGTMQIEA